MKGISNNDNNKMGYIRAQERAVEAMARSMAHANDRHAHKLKMRGLKLKEWRCINGISKIGLCRSLDVHVNTISRWEAGGHIPLDKLIALVEMGFSRGDSMLTANGQ